MNLARVPFSKAKKLLHKKGFPDVNAIGFSGSIWILWDKNKATCFMDANMTCSLLLLGFLVLLLSLVFFYYSLC